MPLPDIIALLLLFAGGVLLFRGKPKWLLLFALGAMAIGAYSAWQLRWQIVPALALAIVAVAAGLWLRKSAPRWPRASGGALALAAVAAAAPYLFFPIFELPVPDGPYQVGARTFDLRDASRRGVLYTAPDAPRDLTATVWYPAAARAEGAVRPYFTRREAFDEGRSASTLWGFPFWRFMSFHSTRTHAIEDVPVATGARFPIVIFSHGYWSYRAQNSALMERLASHGYIVVSLAHPRDGADVRLVGGTLISTALHTGPGGVGDPVLDKRFEKATEAFMGGRTHAERIAALPAYRQVVPTHRLGLSLRAWRDDVLFAARTLRREPPPQVARLFASADFSKTVYAGMSFGGSTAVSACDVDPDCVAAVDLDGENFDGDQFDREVRAPLLLMLTDQPFSSAQPADPGVNPTDYAWERWHCIGSRADIVRLRARGLRHMGLSDLVLSARDPVKSEHFTSLEGRRALALVNDTVLAFLDDHVRGVRRGQFGAALARYPELEPLDTRSLRDYARGLPGREPCRVQERSGR
jgi:predicted dienelactone hydrolase